MRARARHLLGALGAAVLALAALDLACPPDLTRYRTTSVLVVDRDGELLRPFTTPDGMWRFAARRDQVDPAYLDMLLAVEDRRFFAHPGVDPLALGRAALQMARSGHVVSGGSTITMQVARLLMPHRRGIPGKLLDIVRALQLERRYGKDEILAMYLTLAPFGGNIEGARAASLLYFGHEPSRLTPVESALLVALPRRPSALRPDRFPARAAAAQQRVLDRLGAAGKLDARAHDEAVATLGRVGRAALPFTAAHLAQRLRRTAPAGGTLRTTLDARLQRAVEDLAAREAPWLGEGANLAILVVENRAYAVRAYVGGLGFFGAAGQVDLVQARRSPGSTLKPFIYALAFDDRLILPDTLIDDRPMRFGDYAPMNFDRGFQGMVTAREALQESLNIPAVQLLERVGAARFAAALRQAGATLSFPQRGWSAGLPLALGGVGISLADLTMLYVGLANGGQAAPLALLADADPSTPTRFLGARGSAEVGAILRDSPLPDGLAVAAAVRRGRPIAFKTGTSYGFRDAWSVGYSADWTIGVWVGRSDGTPRPGWFGRNTAAPLLHKLFDALPADRAPPPVVEAQAIPAVASPALRQFRPHHEALTLPGATAAPQILFPPDGAVIELAHAGDRLGPLTLHAEGGAPPYRWAVNGMPVDTPALRRTALWQPDGPGFVRVTVTDDLNHFATADVQVK